jgi:nucleotide-binding universal stress UspA family protein
LDGWCLPRRFEAIAPNCGEGLLSPPSHPNSTIRGVHSRTIKRERRLETALTEARFTLRDSDCAPGRSRRVVVCGVSDGRAQVVVRQAQQLSATLGAGLVLAHVAQSTNPARAGIRLPFDPATYRSGALERGRAVLKQAGHQALRAGARGRVELGSWPSRIVALAAEEEAMLVVVGRPHRATLGARGIARLVQRCPCPVVFV